MKYCGFAVITMLLLCVVGLSSIAEPTHAPVPQITQGIFFVDSSHGWMLRDEGSNRYLFRTADGGKTWSRIGQHPNFFQLYFNDSQTGWALEMSSSRGPRTLLYRTNDGGTTWSRRATVAESKPNNRVLIQDFRFLNEMDGWFVGQGSGGIRIVLSTHDGGKSVTNRSDKLPGNEAFTSIYSAGKNLWLFGKDSIFASFDAGQTWTAQVDNSHGIDQLGSFLLNSGLVFANGRGWAAGSEVGPVILGTNDAGKHWGILFHLHDTFFTDISFGDDQHGCATTINTQVFCTADGGKTWNQVSVPMPQESKNPLRGAFSNKIRFSSPQRVWLIARDGTLFRSDDAGTSWMPFLN